jgi:hypothetical protein
MVFLANSDQVINRKQQNKGSEQEDRDPEQGKPEWTCRQNGSQRDGPQKQQNERREGSEKQEIAPVGAMPKDDPPGRETHRQLLIFTPGVLFHRHMESQTSRIGQGLFPEKAHRRPGAGAKPRPAPGKIP